MPRLQPLLAMLLFGILGRSTVLAQSVSVTPNGAFASQPASTSGFQYVFDVHNSDGLSDTYFTNCTRTGAVSSCSASPSIVTVPGGDHAAVTVTYATGTPGSGRIRLRAFSDETAAQDTGWVNVSVTAQTGAPVVSLAPYAQNRRDIGGCLAACFNLLSTHSTPAYYSLDTPRSATLIGASHTARPTPTIQLDVTPAAGTTALTYKIELRRASDNTLLTLQNGQTSAYYTAGAASTRVAVVFDARTNSLATGAHSLNLTVTATLTVGGPASTTVATKVLVVDRSSSVFGPGWWLAGLQQVYPGVNGASRVVVEGDGTAWYYGPPVLHVHNATGHVCGVELRPGSGLVSP